MHVRSHTRHAHAVATLVALASAAVTLAAIVLLGRLAANAEQHAVLLLATTGIALLCVWSGLRQVPLVRAAAAGGIVVTLALALIVGAALSRPTMVDEVVVRASTVATTDATEPAATSGATRSTERAPAPGNVLVARGSFEPLEHAGRGTASIIRTADGRHVLTLTDFSTDAGPDLVVRLVAGNPGSDAQVERGEHVTLGRLKGTSGDQQYVLPRDVDPERFTHAYVWCRAFSVGFTRARLA